MIEIPRGIESNVLNLRNVLSKFGQGAFYAYSDTTQTITHNGGITRLVMNTEVIDNNSWLYAYDDATYPSCFNPKQPGYYLLFAQCTILNADNADFASGTDYFTFCIRKNAATPTRLTYTGEKRQSPSYCCILEANGSSDYFDVAGTFSGSAGETIKVSWSAFGGVFVSYNNP